MVIDISIKEDIKKYLESRSKETKDKALIISAYKMSKDELENIKNSFNFLKGYRLSNRVDTQIIGGFIIKFGSKIIDLSLNTGLNNFKRLFYEIN